MSFFPVDSTQKPAYEDCSMQVAQKQCTMITGMRKGQYGMKICNKY